ncbi:MAG: DUF4956 domain-containing protein [Clostridiales bacterium]|nr:DUF4956 domain-containing protein [Clostridiales bacterium]
MDFLSSIFSTDITTSLDAKTIILVMLASLISGLLISFVYLFTHKKEGYSQSFCATLVMLPIIISIIILLVGNSVARAFSLAGAFTIIRFRSAPGTPKDIAYVFFTLAAGLAYGMGYIAYGALFTIVLCAIMVVLYLTNYAHNKNTLMHLKITVPEDLNYQGAFDDILGNYTTHYKLTKVKTVDFGALFELNYSIILKDNIDQKKFIDELRCRNGNLTILLNMTESNTSFAA